MTPADRTIHANSVFSSSAIDPDIPSNGLTYAKASGPEGDDGSPSLSATANFVVTADAPPLITSIHKTGDVATTTWRAIPGTSYRVQYGVSLADGIWNDLSGHTTASGNSASIEDSSADATRFYRVVVLP